MKWMPLKPKFRSMCEAHRYKSLGFQPDDWSDGLTKSDFNEWYDREIKPLFENAVEVTGALDGNNITQPFGQVRGSHDIHNALLIKIEPIKKETAEDLLREYVNLGLGKMAKACSYRDRENEDESLHERARRVLDQSEKK